MHSPFETAPAASAIPIYFVTKSNWVAISKELPAQAQQFALTNDFTAKPGKCLTLPSPDGQIALVLFGLEEETSKSRDLFRPGALPGCCRLESIALPMRRTTRVSLRSLSRSGAIASAAIARRKGPTCG